MSAKSLHITADIISLDLRVEKVELHYEQEQVPLEDVESMLESVVDHFRKILVEDYLSVGVPLPKPVLGGNGPLPLE
jgi:division protein CdvB (Snf7/Vps24/ESCRT-III family)